jgi:hypothetical protein
MRPRRAKAASAGCEEIAKPMPRHSKRRTPNLNGECITSASSEQEQVTAGLQPNLSGLRRRKLLGGEHSDDLFLHPIRCIHGRRAHDVRYGIWGGAVGADGSGARYCSGSPGLGLWKILDVGDLRTGAEPPQIREGA